MLQIGDTLVSLDILERQFVCDPAMCKGACCVEGDAGAPLEKDELLALQKILPVVWDDLLPEAQGVIREQGVAYIDEEGDTVTSIVKGRNCVFTCYDSSGICRCTIEEAWSKGRTDFRKPVSCHLYPIRVKSYETYKAVNYNRWRICRCAEALGEKEKTPLYRFLRDALIRKFGEEWYEELDLCAVEWMKRIQQR
ncbi:MAG: DUF3109 family protein [Tannerellaceae bacterium]|jgi:hypothetical protein|nr:DUF3109 family protein [Tannerellaceae bacterium]